MSNIHHLLSKINAINVEIKEAECIISDLRKKKTNLIKKLQHICPHLKYTEYVECYTDEYGSDCYGDCIRKCVVCELTEKGVRKYCSYPEPSIFTKLIGKQVKSSKLDVINNEGGYCCSANLATPLHSCPYKSEINGDETLCDCCEACEHECAMEI